MPPRRHKYGVFFHPQVPDPPAAAQQYVDGLLKSFVDSRDPALGTVEIRWQFSLTRIDGSAVFLVEHKPGSLMLFSDDGSGPIRAGILEALDWWNSETILIAPADQALEWNGPELPNAWTRSWTGGLVVQNITQYPKRLGHRVLAEWNPGLRFLFFELTYTPPTQEQESIAVHAWWKEQKTRVGEALAEMTADPAGPWFWASPESYRSAVGPNPETLRPVGTLEAAEALAESYRGLCFLINAVSGETLSRWGDR